MFKEEFKGIFWLLLFSCVVCQCSRKELDRVGEEVATCVIMQQDMLREVEKIFVGNIYNQVNRIETKADIKASVQEAKCVMVENIKDKCVRRWRQCYQEKEVKNIT
jgi:hypothetical protein